MAQFITTRQISSELEVLIREADKTLYLVSPYLKLSKDFQELINSRNKNEKKTIIIYGKSDHKAGVISFNVSGQHPFDVGTLLDKYGIAVRTGHHCTQPLMQCLDIQGTIRISFAIYNTKQEIDFFIEKLKKVITMLS